MAQVVIRNIDDRVIERLKSRAAGRRQSLEQTLRDILADAASPTRAEIVAEMDRIRSMTPNRLRTDSAKLIREARDRR